MSLRIASLRIDRFTGRFVYDTSRFRLLAHSGRQLCNLRQRKGTARAEPSEQERDRILRQPELKAIWNAKTEGSRATFRRYIRLPAPSHGARALRFGRKNHPTVNDKRSMTAFGQSQRSA
jgi:hypothetical protein